MADPGEVEMVESTWKDKGKSMGAGGAVGGFLSLGVLALTDYDIVPGVPDVASLGELQLIGLLIGVGLLASTVIYILA